MNHHRNILSLVLLSAFALGLAGCLTGCAGVPAGSDPLVVRAEQVTLVSMDTIDAFLKFERANETALGPKVHAVAETLRREAPRAIRASRAATKTYKANRNADNKATLETVLSVLGKLAEQAAAELNKPTAMLSSPALAVAPVAIAAILQAITLLLGLIAKERARLAQAGELSAEQDAEIDAEVEQVLGGPAWKSRDNQPI